MLRGIGIRNVLQKTFVDRTETRRGRKRSMSVLLRRGSVRRGTLQTILYVEKRNVLTGYPRTSSKHVDGTSDLFGRSDAFGTDLSSIEQRNFQFSCRSRAIRYSGLSQDHQTPDGFGYCTPSATRRGVFHDSRLCRGRTTRLSKCDDVQSSNSHRTQKGGRVDGSFRIFVRKSQE